MSSTHLRLEGPDLPSLLDQVRAEYGPGARVVHAERIRRGGVGGFFARERYHLEVEVHEAAAGGGYPGDHHGGRTAGFAPGHGDGHRAGTGPAASAGRGAGATAGQGLTTGPTARTVMDLVEQLNQEEHVAQQRHAGTPGAVGVSGMPGAVAVSGMPGASGASGGGTVAAPWAAGAGSQSAPTLLAALASTAAGGTAPMSTESSSFADVLSRLQHSVEGTPAPAATPGAASTPVPDAVPRVPDEPPSFIRLGADPWPVPAAPGGGPDVLRQPAAPRQPTVPVRAPVSERPGGAHQSAAAQHPVVTQAEHARPHPQPRPPGRGELHLDESAALVARAMRLGVPAEVLEDAFDAPTVYRRLLSWVESRPPAPLMVPAPGQVIAVVGELSAAMRVARTLSFELGVDPSGIHLAVPATSSGHDVPVGQLLSDPADIAVRRHRWRQSSGSTIVVVEAALPPAARAWVSSVLSALAPTFTWAVAQASTKVADVVSWAAVIGEVDAVALENVPATGDPAASLAGPLPIGLLDGRRASVSRWMAMLTMEGGRR